MPWFFNPTPDMQAAPSMKGDTLSFPSRQKTYVKPEQMSAYVWNLVRERKLANRGGDPKPISPRLPLPALAKVEKKKDLSVLIPEVSDVTRSDTSSSHHLSHAKVANESQGNKQVEKRAKAVKKQSDIQKKDTQGNSTDQTEANAAEIPNKRRRSSKKKH